ncbi:MAG: hypothetical protein IK079_05540 [Desulfovibrio sp.]|nr:hypothetical protein [Desulfovibrio sp.]
MELKGKDVTVFTLSKKGRSHFNNILSSLSDEKLIKITLLFTEIEEVKKNSDDIMWIWKWKELNRKIHDRGIRIFWSDVVSRLDPHEYLIVKSSDDGAYREYGSFHGNSFHLRLNTSITFEEAV